MENETRSSKKNNETKKYKKVLIGIGLLAVAILVGAVVGILASSKIDKKNDSAESAISRVESKNSSSEAKEKSESAEKAAKEENAKVDENNNNDSNDQRNQSDQQNDMDANQNAANAQRYGTANQALWPVRERILNKVYKHLNGDSPVGFGIRMNEVKGGFSVYVGHQGPGAFVGTIRDNGNGTYTYAPEDSTPNYTFSA